MRRRETPQQRPGRPRELRRGQRAERAAALGHVPNALSPIPPSSPVAAPLPLSFDSPDSTESSAADTLPVSAPTPRRGSQALRGRRARPMDQGADPKAARREAEPGGSGELSLTVL